MAVLLVSGVLNELRVHLQTSLESQKMLQEQVTGLAQLKVQVSQQESAQAELKRQAIEIKELRRRLVSSDESIMHMKLTQKVLAQKANMIDEQVWSQSGSLCLLVCSLACLRACLLA